jgi:sugar phosphate permease
MPATLSIITNVFPREERGKAIGVWAGMAAIGVGLGRSSSPTATAPCRPARRWCRSRSAS